MGNLGPYEEFTTMAKSVGGVEQLLDDISSAAVAKATPKLVALGVVAGGALVIAVNGGRVLLARYRTIQRAGHDAEDQLRSAVERPSGSGESVAGAIDDSNEPDESPQP